MTSETEAVAYMRCSGNGQIHGDTWDRQSAAINSYAAAHNIQIVAEYRDEGVSGTTELENRPGLATCLDRIESNGVHLVLVEDATRLARDFMVSELIVRQFQQAGATIISASGGVNLTEGNDSNPTAQLIRGILALVAHWQRCVDVLKLRAARQRIKAKTGHCEGRKKYGTQPGETLVLARMRQMRDAGQKWFHIAEALNAEGIKPRHGQRWWASTVQRIVSRQPSNSSTQGSTI